ncbi:hypothetical protein VTN96DRAFT_5717 [Rasamsonia emersonii]
MWLRWITSTVGRYIGVNANDSDAVHVAPWKHRLLVFQQDNAFGRQPAKKLPVLGGVSGGFLLGHLTPVCLLNKLQDLPSALIDCVHGDGPGGQRRREKSASPLRGAGHLEIESRSDGLGGGIRSVPSIILLSTVSKREKRKKFFFSERGRGEGTS